MRTKIKWRPKGGHFENVCPVYERKHTYKLSFWIVFVTFLAEKCRQNYLPSDYTGWFLPQCNKQTVYLVLWFVMILSVGKEKSTRLSHLETKEDKG